MYAAMQTNHQHSSAVQQTSYTTAKAKGIRVPNTSPRCGALPTRPAYDPPAFVEGLAPASNGLNSQPDYQKNEGEPLPP